MPPVLERVPASIRVRGSRAQARRTPSRTPGSALRIAPSRASCPITCSCCGGRMDADVALGLPPRMRRNLERLAGAILEGVGGALHRPLEIARRPSDPAQSVDDILIGVLDGGGPIALTCRDAGVADAGAGISSRSASRPPRRLVAPRWSNKSTPTLCASMCSSLNGGAELVRLPPPPSTARVRAATRSRALSKAVRVVAACSSRARALPMRATRS